MHKPYDHKCDIYSYGMLLWETLHGKVPFTGMGALQAAFAVPIKEARPPICLSEEFECYSTLIEACWDTEPSRRPDMDEVTHAATEALRRTYEVRENAPRTTRTPPMHIEHELSVR